MSFIYIHQPSIVSINVTQQILYVIIQAIPSIEEANNPHVITIHVIY
jgi:hypothetical protein